MTALLTVSGIVAICVALFWWRLSKAHNEIEQLLKDNAKLEQQNAVVTAQVKNANVRKRNEENSHNFDRTAVIERLREQNDLRD